MTVVDSGPLAQYFAQAPERMELEGDEEFNGPAADMYSVGCTIFHMLAGEPPFPLYRP